MLSSRSRTSSKKDLLASPSKPSSHASLNFFNKPSSCTNDATRRKGSTPGFGRVGTPKHRSRSKSKQKTREKRTASADQDLLRKYSADSSASPIVKSTPSSPIRPSEKSLNNGSISPPIDPSPTILRRKTPLGLRRSPTADPSRRSTEDSISSRKPISKSRTDSVESHSPTSAASAFGESLMGSLTSLYRNSSPPPAFDLGASAILTATPSKGRGKPNVVTNTKLVFTGWKLTRRPEVHLSDLEVVKGLGAGQFGKVIKMLWTNGGSSSSSGRPEHFAMKMLERARFTKPVHQEMVLTEKRTMEQLQSKFVVEIINTYKTPTRLYLLMEFIDGGDLDAAVIQRHVTLSVTDLRRYTACLVLALEHLRQHSIIHRDIKPANLLLDKHTNTIKLCDFGYAKFLNEYEYTSTLVGSWAYLSPARCQQEFYGHDHEVWSLAVSLFELAYHKCPFEADQEDPEYAEKTSALISTSPFAIPEKRDSTLPLAGRLFLNQILSSKTKVVSLRAAKQHAWFGPVDWRLL